MAIARAASLTGAVALLAAAAVLAPPADAATGGVPQSVCSRPAPGHARCDADVLVARRGHALIRPIVVASPVVEHRIVMAGRGAAALDRVTIGAGEPEPGTPAALQQAYDLGWLSANRGTGNTVAVVDAGGDPTAAADLAVFRAASGLPACTQGNGCLTIVNQQGQGAPLPSAESGWQTEESLDIQAVSAICPNCRIDLVEANSDASGDLLAALHEADGLAADEISASWSVAISAPLSTGDFLAALPSGRFPALLAASGDTGADTSGVNEWPAALPFATAVGGTTLSPSDAASNARGYTESAWADAGSGCDTSESSLSWAPDTDCAGRAWSDVSADGDPATGLDVYDSAMGGWVQAGGTSLATPIVAAFEALTGVAGATSQWAYADSGLLNAVAGGSNGSCGATARLLCDVGFGWSGPTGAGTISGDIAAGAPQVAAPPIRGADGANTYTVRATSSAGVVAGGVYPNGEATVVAVQYGAGRGYFEQSAPVSIPAGARPVSVTVTLTGLLPGTRYHFRLVAANAAGLSVGYDDSLTTAIRLPSAGGGGRPPTAAAARATASHHGDRHRRRGRRDRHRIDHSSSSSHRAQHAARRGRHAQR